MFQSHDLRTQNRRASVLLFSPGLLQVSLPSILIHLNTTQLPARSFCVLQEFGKTRSNWEDFAQLKEPFSRLSHVPSATMTSSVSGHVLWNVAEIGTKMSTCKIVQLLLATSHVWCLKFYKYLETCRGFPRIGMTNGSSNIVIYSIAQSGQVAVFIFT